MAEARDTAGATTGLLRLAEEAVASVEPVFLDGLGARPKTMKGTGDFATEKDLEIEELLRHRLGEGSGLPVLGEEHGGEPDRERYWVVDPIDGTTNYATANPLCAILVALVDGGRPVVAVTAAPPLGIRLSAAAGGRLRDRGEELPPREESPDVMAQVGFSSISSHSHPTPSEDRRLELLDELGRSYLRPRITGSIGLDLSFAARGFYGAAVSLSPHVWDNAAGALLVEAAGGLATDLAGNPWRVGADGLVAGAPRAHAEVLRRVEQVRRRGGGAG